MTTFLSSICIFEKLEGQFPCIFLVYSPFNLQSIFFIITFLLYLCDLPPFIHSLDFHFLKMLRVVTLFLHQSFTFHLPFYPSSRLRKKVTLFWLSFIFCITTYHPSFRLWICLCYEVIQTCLQLSLPLFFSNLSFIHHHHYHPSLIQSFLHLYHLSLVAVVYVCLTLCHAVYWPSLLFWSTLLQLFRLSYLL